MGKLISFVLKAFGLLFLFFVVDTNRRNKNMKESHRYGTTEVPHGEIIDIDVED